MVFPSLPAYFDPTNPANWQQRPPATTQQHFSQQQEQPPPPHQPSHGSIRPGSMAERARMANIPMPETALKCPRCESTNTKFCYFNNYNLSQPRHFCKTCRRYWTRGGALRNVPVGGGCRKNKRTKSNNSNNNNRSSSANTNSNVNTSSDVGPTSSLGSIISSFKSGLLPTAAAAGGHDHMLGLGSTLPSSSQRLLNDFPNEINLEGLSYGAVSGPMSQFLGFEQWRFPGMTSSQLPLLGSLDISSSSFQHTGMEQPVYGGTGSGNRFRPNMFQSSASGSGSIKFENNNNHNQNNNNNNNQDLNIQFLGNNEQQLWGDVSNFGSSSPNNNAL